MQPGVLPFLCARRVYFSNWSQDFLHRVSPVLFSALRNQCCHFVHNSDWSISENFFLHRKFELKPNLFCGEVGLVTTLHLLFGEVRSVTTVLKVVEEEQEGLQGIEREGEEEEVGWNGELKVEEWHSLHAWMTWDTRTTRALSQDVVCRSWQPLLDYAHTGSRVHQFTLLKFMCAVWKVLKGLDGHVVIGVVRLVARFHHSCAIPNVEIFLDIAVQLCTCSENRPFSRLCLPPPWLSDF